MTTSAEQIRAFTGPAILSYGFRPFFLFGALWAAIAVAVWLPMLSGTWLHSTAAGQGVRDRITRHWPGTTAHME